jgi:hypothetical protein
MVESRSFRDTLVLSLFGTTEREPKKAKPSHSTREVAELKAQLQEKNEVIEYLEKRVNSLSKSEAECQLHIANLEHQIMELTATLQKRTDEINILKKECSVPIQGSFHFLNRFIKLRGVVLSSLTRTHPTPPHFLFGPFFRNRPPKTLF